MRKNIIRPIIFCPTHIGGVDIEMSFLAIRTACWLVLGNLRELYKNISGMMLQMNGLIPMELLQKPDRKEAKAQMEALIKKGGNLLLFPEGIQNVSVNTLVGYLYAGAVELVITCGVEIVPIAIGRDEGTYNFMFGKNISYENCTYEDCYRLTTELRDRLATLKWDVVEKLPHHTRKAIPESYYDSFIQDTLTMNTEYTLT